MATRVSLLDRIVGYISPRAGLDRHLHRSRLARAYEAASPMDRWKPRRSGASANADHMADATRLRAKSRALIQNVPYVRAGIEGLVDHTVGTGILDRATGAEAKAIDKLKAAWKQVCDADGRLDYDGLVAAAYRAMEQDGEVLIRLRPRYATDGLPVPLQLQLLEIDWIDSTKTGGVNGGTVVNGIEYDVLGRLVAYWLWETHPGDTTLMRGSRAQSKRIDAANIIHLFSPERPGQGRGFPRLAAVIPRVRDLQLYEDAELNRKNLETRLGVLYSGDPATLANPAADGQALSTSEIDSTGNLGDLPSGMITRLPNGSDVTVVAPTVATGYVEYIKQQLHIISAGMGSTYEILTGDMSEVNFSSARVRRLDYRRAIERMQWLTLKPRLLDAIHRAFIDAAQLAGKIGTRNYGVRFSFPKWDYVNPQQEIEADTKEIAAGLCSISEKIRQRGYEPDEVFAEIASDFDKLRKLGILDTLMFMQKGKDQGEAQAAAEVAKSGAAAARMEAQQTRDASQHFMATLMQTVLDRPAPPPPAIHLRAGDTTVNLPEPNVTVESVVNVPPAETVVNVAAPEVRLDVAAPAAPVVNVAPAEVRVINEVQPAQVELSLPARTIVSEHERDKAGRVTRTVTKES